MRPRLVTVGLAFGRFLGFGVGAADLVGGLFQRAGDIRFPAAQGIPLGGLSVLFARTAKYPWKRCGYPVEHAGLLKWLVPPR